MDQNAKDYSITLPEIYLSTDPKGAKTGVDCAWQNYYKLDVEDIGDSGLFVSRVTLRWPAASESYVDFALPVSTPRVFLTKGVSQ